MISVKYLYCAICYMCFCAHRLFLPLVSMIWSAILLFYNCVLLICMLLYHYYVAQFPNCVLLSSEIPVWFRVFASLSQFKKTKTLLLNPQKYKMFVTHFRHHVLPLFLDSHYYNALLYTSAYWFVVSLYQVCGPCPVAFLYFLSSYCTFL
jgi:hypothetical protein